MSSTDNQQQADSQSVFSFALQIPGDVSFNDLCFELDHNGRSAQFNMEPFIKVWIASGYSREQMDSTPRYVLMTLIVVWYKWERENRSIDSNAGCERMIADGYLERLVLSRQPASLH
jgi:hypothetical protein